MAMNELQPFSQENLLFSSSEFLKQKTTLQRRKRGLLSESRPILYDHKQLFALNAKHPIRFKALTKFLFDHNKNNNNNHWI